MTLPIKEVFEIIPSGDDIQLIFKDSTIKHENSKISEFIKDSSIDKAIVRINSVDIYSALEKASNMLSSLLLLSNLKESYNKYNPNMSKDVIVLDLRDNTPYFKKSFYFGSNVRISNLQSILKVTLSENNNINFQTKDSLTRALHWCRIANYSPEESKFLALWGVIEFLLSGHSNKIIKDVVKYFIPFSGTYYCKKYINNVQTIMDQDNPITYQELKDEVLKEFNQKSLRLGDLFQYLYKDSASIETRFNDNDLLLRKLRWLSGCLSERKLLFNKIKDLEKKVSSDLKRMYRLRNMLAHRAHVGEKTLEANLRWLVFHLQIVFENLLHIYEKNPEYSIEEILTAKEISYQNYLRKLQGYVFPTVDFKDVILPYESFI